ncbi:MAG TPA: hypothetical protein VI968_04395, partial [archaeon]|nr:hypothetical protein [archaeon]
MVNNQQTDKIIEKIKQEIIKKTNPISIFLYGSYNTPDYLPGVSDLEFGVIKEDKVSISKILRNIADIYSTTDMRFRLYSYELEKLKNMTFDSPFTKSVFIRHLILTSKTTWGKQIVENLPLPPITLLDAYREATFSTMRALSGIFFLRTNNIEESNEMGYKACLFATLSLEYILGEFPIGFKNIVNTSKKLGLDKESNRLIEFAYKLRQE